MMEVTMRIAFAIILLAAAAPFDTAQADPYRWCALYGGGGQGGGRNCYFITLEQCRWAISGNGGDCVPNPFYDGRPVVTPEDGVRVKHRLRNY
jgi:Protein of unknown function (DUF3551)